MRLTTAYTIAAAATMLLAACGGGGTKAVAPAAQSITVTPELLREGASDTLRFGRLHKGEVAVKTLRIENGCEKPVVPLRHATSCGCVTLDYARRPIAPEASGDVRFEFDSRGEQGWQMKLIEFYFADSARPLKLYVEAEVE